MVSTYYLYSVAHVTFCHTTNTEMSYIMLLWCQDFATWWVAVVFLTRHSGGGGSGLQCSRQSCWTLFPENLLQLFRQQAFCYGE